MLSPKSGQLCRKRADLNREREGKILGRKGGGKILGRKGRRSGRTGLRGERGERISTGKEGKDQEKGERSQAKKRPSGGKGLNRERVGKILGRKGRRSGRKRP